MIKEPTTISVNSHCHLEIGYHQLGMDAGRFQKIHWLIAFIMQLRLDTDALIKLPHMEMKKKPVMELKEHLMKA